MTEVRRYDDAAGTTLVSNTGYGYDDGGRVESIHHKDDANATLNHIQYTYDAADRVKQESSTLGLTRNYDYDAASQLLGDGTDSYSYDLSGNRTLAGYQTGANNELETNGVWDYTYDDEGNLTQKEETGGGIVWLYGYDHNNRLVEVERKASSSDPVDLRVNFAYDPLGNRTLKSVDADGDGVGAAAVTKFGYEAHGNAWADLTSGGSLITRRFYADAVDALFARMDASSGDEAWYLTDRLGSVRDLVDHTGTAFNHLDWGSYGELVTETGTGSDRYGWTGRERDLEIELQYNRARYYDWETGRWISQDPIGFDAGDGNLYRYVRNRPSNASDSSGLEEVTMTHRTLPSNVPGIIENGFDPRRAENGLTWFAGPISGPGFPSAPLAERRSHLTVRLTIDLPEVPARLLAEADQHANLLAGGPHRRAWWPARWQYVMDHGGELVRNGFMYRDGEGMHYALTERGLIQARPEILGGTDDVLRALSNARAAVTNAPAGAAGTASTTAVRAPFRPASGATIAGYAHLGQFVATWALGEYAGYQNALKEAETRSKFASKANEIDRENARLAEMYLRPATGPSPYAPGPKGFFRWEDWERLHGTKRPR